MTIHIEGAFVDAIDNDPNYSSTLQDAIASVIEVDKSYVKVGACSNTWQQSMGTIEVNILLYYPTTASCQNWLSALATAVYDGSLTSMIVYKAAYSDSKSLKAVKSTLSISTTSMCVIDTSAPTTVPTYFPTYLPSSIPTYLVGKPTPIPTSNPTYVVGSPTPGPSITPTYLPHKPTPIPTSAPT